MTFAWTRTELNDEQSQVVREENSVFLVACPGSGKTRTLTYKIAYELSRLQSKRQFIVALTYTNRAADEIHERIEELGVDTSQLWTGTIHSFCLEWILKPYAIYEPALARGFRIMDSHEQEKLLEELCRAQRGITYWDCEYYFTDQGYVLGCTDQNKHERLHAVFAQYFRYLADNRQIDFEQILFYASRLIQGQPQIAKVLASIFSWILIDEYQDTKRIQYSIVAAITRAGAERTKLFVVGDPNQAIFGSLGGFAMPLAEFRQLSGIRLEERALTENYRSTDRLIRYFSNFTVQATGIRGAASDRAFPSNVSYNITVERDQLETELVRLIRLSTAQGFAAEQICILAPWWILLAGVTRRLAGALPEYQFDGPGMVPFSRDQENFWYRLSRIALTEASPTQYVRRLRWAAEVIRDLGNEGINTPGLSAKWLLRESNSIQLNQPDGLLYLREFFASLMERLGIDWQSHPLLLEHHQAFFDSSAAKIDRLRREGAEFIDGIDFFRKVFQHRSGITVNTIHGVKGAEFDVVIAFGLLQGMVPHFSEEAGADRGTDSAKKLLYVVGSRARKHLHLISERQRMRGGGRGPYAATNALAACVFDYDVV
ncbi:UvrD-helicase domain-containing protein [Ralstonia solanacearum]|uniref:UvrD-helicase domain-containing protein n=1 Tax=Ralstonia solanacearum TaxID=305 RepID=UPI0001D96AD7|nr:ATP-dependent helicase [Ralstonia solanacearum]CBJ35968.1 putative DNA helicase, DNA helicase UvrD/REP type domain [Ralstonia solanacearum PSI07]